MLRATNLPDPKFRSNVRLVDVDEVWVAYGSLASSLPYNEKVIFTREDLRSQGVQIRDKTVIENELTIDVSTPEGLPGPDVRVSYRFKVANEHEKLKTEAKSIKRTKSQEFPVSVPPNTIQFVKLKYQERRLYGMYSNLLGQKERYVVIEEIIRPAGGESITFKYVDEVKDGQAFASLWKKAKGNTSVPTGPRKPSVANINTPVPTPTPANADVEEDEMPEEYKDND